MADDGAKLTVNINDKTKASLIDLAERDGVSITEVVRRAVSVYSFISDAMEDPTTDLVLRKGGTDTYLELI